jgi:3,4-dihydroxy 2-butanone 4-phosphate synthase/GTP cyclohydrolase II
MQARKVAESKLPTRFGMFRLVGFESESTGENVFALVMGDPATVPNPLIRVHSQCLTGEAFGSSRCDCGEQLELALQRIADEGHGILVYQLAEGRGIGLMNKVHAYQLQDSGHDTVEANHRLGFEADARSYDLCGAVLKSFGLKQIRLMSNNPLKVAGLEAAGIHPVERIPIEITPSPTSEAYLRTKKDKLGHILTNL